MFYNSLKLAWRNLLKSKYTSAINLLGLTVGMTAALLIWHFVAFEKSYDKFHEHEASIVRVKTDRVKDGEVFMEFAAGATAAGPFMQQYFPEVDTFVKMNVFGEGIFRHKDQVFRETKAYFVSNGLFEVFSIPLIKGNSNTCLEGPRKALITESTAKKFFGDSEPMGQRIQRNGEDEFEITGVIKDWPENSHLKPQILMSYATYQGYMGNTPDLETAMYWDGFLTYLKLQPNVNINELQDKIPAKMGEVYDQDVREDVVFVLQKLEDIHLFSNHLFEAEANGDGHAVQYLFFIGCLVLLIAWFNYVNLATARSETRAREVGVRKVIGSGRGDLIRQFLLEAALLNIVAIISSIVLAQLLSPTFDQLAGKEIPTRLLDNPSLLSAVVLVFLGGTVLTGLYPAFILSGYKPATALSGMVGKGSNGSLMRKSLVVIQFAVSVILIAGTIIIFQQLMHLQKTKLGVNIEQTVVVNAPMVFDSTYQAKYAAFKKEVTRIAGVQQITGSTDVPGQQVGWTAAIRIWGADDNSFEGLQAIAMDADFGEQFGLEAVAGRLLSPDMLSDSAACVLNERGVERLRIESPEAAIGMEVDFWGDRLKIVGVVKNFHQRSPKMEFEPLILRLSDPESPPAYFSIRTTMDESQEVLSSLQGIWGRMFPGNPFEYFFLDDHFAKQYEADQRLGSLIALFAGLAIFVSCLGLFALAAFVAERRTKEIGIRKVLGASVESLVALLSKEFIVLVGISIMIAIPIGWLLMNNWLNNFVTRINLQWWVFGLAGIMAIVIAFITMSFQSIKSALSNPIESLRNE